MSLQKPDTILEVLLAREPMAEQRLLLKTSSEGIIQQIFGNVEHFSAPWKVGKDVSEIFPFLVTFFPAAPLEMLELPRMIWEKFYLDFLIFRESDDATWILITDVTAEVNEIKEQIQTNNDFILSSSRQFTFENPFGNLHLFNVLSLIKTNENKFVPVGGIPLWAEKYYPAIASVRSGLEIGEAFPYLEVFLPMADAFWQTADETRLEESDMWIENPAGKDELHFRAFAANRHGNHFLFIRLLDQNDIPVSQQTLQKAREHQLLYEKLQKAENKLKQLLQYKDKFVSIVSHDLRSPMASVVSIAEMFLTDEELLACMNDFNREMLQSMKEELVRLLEYNNRLYHWANLELGNFKLDKEKIKVKKLVDSAVQTAQPKTEAKQIDLTSSVTPEDLETEVDVSLFLQVFNNLIGNAVKFTPEGGKITLHVKKEKGKIRYAVSDTGVGMPEKIKKSIFSGVPGESTLGTSGEKGSGLGLDIVKKIVDAHGFSIEVQSEQGKGTTFIITETIPE